MTDEEKIEQAAITNCNDEGWDTSGHFEDVASINGFKIGVRWRDENPSPKVLALVEALNKVMDEGGSNSRLSDATLNCVAKALAKWDKK